MEDNQKASARLPNGQSMLSKAVHPWRKLGAHVVALTSFSAKQAKTYESPGAKQVYQAD
jgi:hypothetical protein